MNENQVNNLIDQKLRSFTNGITPQHRHNGSDAPQIPPENLLPYSPYDPNSSATELANSQLWGTFRLYNQFDGTFNPPSYYGYGFQLFWNNKWNILDLADFYIYATQSIPQVISSGSTATIVFNTVESQEPTLPTPFYDNVTGVWDIPETAAELVTATVTFATPTSPGDVVISFNDGPIVRSFTQSVTDDSANAFHPFSVTITAVNKGTTLTGQKITVKNNTGASITTTKAFLQVKQLK